MVKRKNKKIMLENRRVWHTDQLSAYIQFVIFPLPTNVKGNFKFFICSCTSNQKWCDCGLAHQDCFSLSVAVIYIFVIGVMWLGPQTPTWCLFCWLLLICVHKVVTKIHLPPLQRANFFKISKLNSLYSSSIKRFFIKESKSKPKQKLH